MAEQMKPSGIDWIRDIPINWKCSKVKFCFSLVNGSTPDSSDYDCWDGDIRWITPADMSDTGTISQGERFITKYGYNSCGTTLLPAGSIVISSRAPIGKINITTAELCTNQGCKSLIRTADNRYFYYLFLAGQNELSLLGRGTTFLELSTYDLNEFGIVIPAEDEQKAIADFLDKECAQIDSINADLEKQIELLQQYKKSLITETVTKGLDKSVPMKDSGVEWIGEIPVGWELSRIKYLTDNHHPYPIGDGDHGMIKADDYLTEGIPYIRVLNLTWGSGLNLENLVFISKEMNSLIKNSELKPNDILIAKTGATIGKTAIVPDSLPVSNTTSHVGKITLANVHDAKYFYYVMTSSIVQKQIQDISAMQSTRPELGIEGLKNLILTVPPFDIQQHIARFLDDHCAKIDRVLHEKGKQLSVIKQHKKSLIYEYVTGKKRVKEVQ